MKEKIKNFWIVFKNKWLWFGLVTYIMILIINWIGFFLGFIFFEIALLVTLIYPLIIVSIYYIRKSKFETTIYKIAWIIFGGISLGFPIWALIIFVLIGAPWAPLNKAHTTLRGIISILILIPAYGAAAYLMYKLGKKREFKPLL